MSAAIQHLNEVVQVLTAYSRYIWQGSACLWLRVVPASARRVRGFCRMGGNG